MTDRYDTTLNPCPFCGETPEVHKHFKEPMWRLTHRCWVIGPIVWDWTAPESRIADKWNIRHGQ